MDERQNNRGQVTIFLLVGIVLAFVGVIMIIGIGFFSTNLNSALDIDVQLGQVNLQNATADSIGKFNEMVLVNADWWGMAIIFGMIFGLILGAYFTRNSYPKIGLLIDVGAILLAFFVSLYLSAAYSDVVIALSAVGQDFAVDYLEKTNFFILNLPIFVAIIGTIMFILFHSSIPPKVDELNTVPNVVAA